LAINGPNVSLLPPTRRLCGFKLKGALQQRYSAYKFSHHFMIEPPCLCLQPAPVLLQLLTFARF
jgi:hypothetical protein